MPKKNEILVGNICVSNASRETKKSYPRSHLMDWKLLAIVLPFGYFLLRVIESLTLNVLGNILTDPIRNWVANRSLLSKRKRVNQLQKEFEDITNLNNDRSKFYFRILQNGIFLFGLAILTVVLFIVYTSDLIQSPPQMTAWNLFLSLFFNFFSIAFLVVFILLLGSTSLIIERVMKYDSYKVQVEKQIRKLSSVQPNTH